MKLSRLGTVLVFVIVWSVSARPTLAEVRLPHIFGDHMVLQQHQAIPVWGWATPGEQITVQVAQRSATTTANADGQWRLKLDSLSAGGPFELTVAGTNTVVLHDVLVGEVWLCSGQPNMEWSVIASDHGAEEVAAAQHPQLRLFSVGRNIAEKPVDDVSGAWAACTPE